MGVRGLSLDAFGTILELQPPAGPLVRELREGWGIDLDEAAVWPAFAAEMTFYKAHHLEGRDHESLAGLRRRSAGVLLANLPDPAARQIAPAEFVPAMMRSLGFRPYPDVAPALARLRTSGLAVAVISNWDISLHDFLGETELDPLVDHVVSSAEVGAGKPKAAPFARALELLGLEPAEVVHVGDDPVADVEGARAAGIAPVLIRRAGGSEPPPPGVPVIKSLTDLKLML